MSNAEIAAWELDKKLDGRSLRYKIEDATYYKNHNEKSFDTIREMLERVGVNLEKDDDCLSISINSQNTLPQQEPTPGAAAGLRIPKMNIRHIHILTLYICLTACLTMRLPLK